MPMSSTHLDWSSPGQKQLIRIGSEQAQRLASAKQERLIALNIQYLTEIDQLREQDALHTRRMSQPRARPWIRPLSTSPTDLSSEQSEKECATRNPPAPPPQCLQLPLVTFEDRNRRGQAPYSAPHHSSSLSELPHALILPLSASHKELSAPKGAAGEESSILPRLPREPQPPQGRRPSKGPLWLADKRAAKEQVGQPPQLPEEDRLEPDYLIPLAPHPRASFVAAATLLPPLVHAATQDQRREGELSSSEVKSLPRECPLLPNL